MKLLLPTLALSAFALTGCISTVGAIVTAPVKVAGWTVDKATTSQSEADRNYGRKVRKEEERRGREERQRREVERKRQRDS